MSRILLLGINYWPEVAGIGPYTTALAEHLATREHAVTVLTGYPYYPQWRLHDGYARKFRPFTAEVRNGVRVIRCPFILPRSRQTTFRRIAFDTSIAGTTLLAGCTTGRHDLVICISPPLQLGLTAGLLARIGGARLIVHLQDLVPDAAIAAGLMREGRATRLARALERRVYARADAITVVSEGFLDNVVAKGVPRDKVHLMTNWVDTSGFAGIATAGTRQRLGVSDGEALVLHTGNMGAKQGLETVVDAAEVLREDRVVLGLIGDGQVRSQLEVRAQTLGLTNLRFFDLQDDFTSALAAADILVLSQRGLMVDSVAPSKLLSYMAAGKPIAAGVHAESEAGRLIRKAGCGIVVSPDDPHALAEAIRSLSADPLLRKSMGAAGRTEVERDYGRQALLKQWDNLVRDMARK